MELGLTDILDKGDLFKKIVVLIQLSAKLYIQRQGSMVYLYEDWRENQRTDIYIVKLWKYSGYVVAYEFVGGMMEEKAAYDSGINNGKSQVRAWCTVLVRLIGN